MNQSVTGASGAWTTLSDQDYAKCPWEGSPGCQTTRGEIMRESGEIRRNLAVLRVGLASWEGLVHTYERDLTLQRNQTLEIKRASLM